MQHFLCLHGHFHQPARENPWLDTVELQDSAYPYHDWNERVTAECYAQCTAAPVLDAEGKIQKLINIYSRISFNIAPTLLRWMEEHAPEVYSAILDADKESLERFDGHGAALAQPYIYELLPGVPMRDRNTSILWGIRDFEHHFGRLPEGMWLPEMAVDLDTLEILVDHSIQFTILPPTLASRFRRKESDEWFDASGERIDSTRPYECVLPSGRSIALFFYDGPISRALTLEQLLTSGDNLTQRLFSAFSNESAESQLVNIVTNGEQFGHWTPKGDIALACALDHIERSEVTLTNYARYLQLYPPTWEVELQDWNEPADSETVRVYQVFSMLRETLDQCYESQASSLFHDPWETRDAAIQLFHDRSPEKVERFLREHASNDLTPTDKVAALKLIELQRQLRLMSTRSGWESESFRNREGLQIFLHAGRAIQLAQDLFGTVGEEAESTFLNELKTLDFSMASRDIVSERRPLTGVELYEQFVQSTRVDWEELGAHYAVRSLFEHYSEETKLFCYQANRQSEHRYHSGRTKLLVGIAHFQSEITHDEVTLQFAFIHLGDHHVNGGVKPLESETEYESLLVESREAFERGDFADLIHTLDRHFGTSTWSLKSLFRDEQRRIIREVIQSTLDDARTVLRRLYEQHHPTMQFIANIGAPPPKIFQGLKELYHTPDLRWMPHAVEDTPEQITALLKELVDVPSREQPLPEDLASSAHQLQHILVRLAQQFFDHPEGTESLSTLIEILFQINTFSVAVIELRGVQKIVWELCQSFFPEKLRQLELGDRSVEDQLDIFLTLGEQLHFQMTPLRQQIEKVKSMPTPQELLETILSERRTPRASYRFQFHKDFPFQAGLEQVDYLNELGISDIYSSPVLQARPGSPHGYDVCDHDHINPELGGEEGLNALSEKLHECSMGLIIDSVPNHMGIGHPLSRCWLDVLENGPSSTYADHFDITWEPVNPNLQNKVLLPILEDQYGRVLERGLIRLVYENGSFLFHYHEHRWPVAPGTYDQILEKLAIQLSENLGEESKAVHELKSILTALSYLPERTENDPEKITERNREKEIIKDRLSRLVEGSEEVWKALEARVAALNGTEGEPESFDELDALLDAQAYRPSFWRVATEEINYRRFFDVNDLAAIRVELPHVFHETHHVLLDWLSQRKANGLRIDHPDGLWSPTVYFQHLQTEYVVARARQLVAPKELSTEIEMELRKLLQLRFQTQELSTANGGRPDQGWPLYVVAEKILCEGEELPSDWPVDGTTGYDFLNWANGLFVDRENEEVFQRLHSQFIGRTLDFDELVNIMKKRIMHISMASEINALSYQLDRLSERNRRYRDFTLNSLTFVIREILADLAVYRTYVTSPEGVSDRDREYIEQAVKSAKRRNPRTDKSIFNFLRDTLLLSNIEDFDVQDRPQLIAWTMKFQQVSGPVMAKGVEDTTLYIYNRLTSLNEVGGEPNHFGVSIEDFHRSNQERQEHWPYSMLTTSTHDTKRSEDVRARLNALSEMPGEWEKTLNRWRTANLEKLTFVEDNPAPDRNDEYLIYQTLLGAWPAELTSLEDADGLADFRERIVTYLQKATKEAKVHTSWINPNEGYDNAVSDFVRALLTPGEESTFLQELFEFQNRLAFFGYFNSLSQVLLKFTSPGMPDLYQGTELWDFSLVDPDNRRPVDYQRRRGYLRELNERGEDRLGLVNELLQHIPDGRIKLYLIHQVLQYRREKPQLFERGNYQPVEVTGAKSEHVCAFTRRYQDQEMLVAVPCRIVGLVNGEQQAPLGAEVWQDTMLNLSQPEGNWKNLFTGETGNVIKMSEALKSFPVLLAARN